MDRKRHR